MQVVWARPVSTLEGVLIFIALLALTIYLYRRGAGLPNPIRIALAAARFLALCAVVLVLLEPTAVIEQREAVRRRLAVLVDASESMSVKDQRKRDEDLASAAMALDMLPLTEIDDPRQAATTLSAKQRKTIADTSRLELAKALVSVSGQPVLAALGEELDIHAYRFGKTVERLSTNALAELKAEATGTSIGEALETVANADRGAPLAGIVLLSDGLDTATRRVEDAVLDLGRQGIPVYPVPMGIADPDDVSIRTIIMQEVAFSGDKVPVRVQLQSKGYEKRSADVTVQLNGREVAAQNVTLAGGLQFEELFFNVDIQEKGAARIEVAIDPFSDEATAENNRIERSVRVVNEKINVLCMEGSARWEFRYLRAMLKRDPRINATFVATRGQAELARSSSEYIARFPELREEAFQYDLVILGDVDAGFFAPGELALLEELVKERGGSLLMLCGARFAPGSYAGTAVERMLPVRFDPDAEWEDVDESVYPVLTPEGRSSLVMTLETDPELNDRVWTRVAPLDRLPPLLDPKPGATVLVELSDTAARAERFPLVAWQRYGAGKCMVMGSDRMWLLRFKTGDKYHWRVWSQCIQFLTLSRLMGEHKRIRLETDRTTYPSGEQAQLYAHVLDDAFDPVSQAGFDVLVASAENPDAEPQRVTLRPDQANPGLYEGYFSPPGPGRYQVRANESDEELANLTEFQVADINPEMANTDLQLARLQRIADLSGGEVLAVPTFKKLASLLNRTPEVKTVQTERPLWDTGWVALLLIALLGFEWIVRRRYDLA